jgi:hypothetical protein
MTRSRGARSCAIAALCVAAACGRSGLDGAERIDSGRAADARASDARDAFVPEPFVCPARSEDGFRVVPLGPLTLSAPASDIQLGGDGTNVYLATRAPADYRSVHLYRVEGAATRELLAIEGGAPFPPRLSVVDGVARMLVLGERLRVFEARGDEAREIGSTDLDHLSRFEPVRPAWNGTDIIVAGSTENGFGGPVVFGGYSESWLAPTDAGLHYLQLDAQPDTGITEFFHRVFPDFVMRSFDRHGVERADSVLTGGIAIAEPVFGWLDGGVDAPIALAGMVTLDGRRQLAVQRYRVDGSAAELFSARVGFNGRVHDLAAVPVPPHASGYGLVGENDLAPFFVGAAQDLAGEVAELPYEACWSLAVAAGPCGYVIACATDGAVDLALAVPPPLP